LTVESASGAAPSLVVAGPGASQTPVEDLAAAPDSEAPATEIEPAAEEQAAAESAAAAEAADSGTPVMVDELTTETTLVTALPGGGFQARISSSPVRKLVGDEWVDLDATLEYKAGGGIGPRVGPDSLWLSAGGNAGSVLARYEADGEEFEIRTPFDLPTPSLDGDSATYTEVIPGVDLVAKASNGGGFSYNWVVKTREAAGDPRIRSLSVPIDVDGLQAQKSDGGLWYVDASGIKRFWTPTPIMWDSSGVNQAAGEDGTVSAAEAVEAGPAGSERVARVAVTATEDHLLLKADVNVLDDPDAVFPIVIDPELPLGRNAWTTVWNNFPTTSFWNSDHTLGAGYEGYQDFKVVRSYFRFDATSLTGKEVFSAELNLNQVHAASCSIRWTDVYRTAVINSATTWNNQPARYSFQDSNGSTLGCASNGTGSTGWDVTQGTKIIVGNGDSWGTFMVRAQNESDATAWKQFINGGAELAVTYMSLPKVPTGLYVKSSTTEYSCGTSSTNAPTIPDTTVAIGARVTTSNGSGVDALNGVFRRRDLAESTDKADATGSQTTPGNRTYFTWPVANNHTYRFKVRNRAKASINGNTQYLYSNFNSNWCYFKIKVDPRTAPTVTSTDFSQCQGPGEAQTCTASGTAETAGVITAADTNADATKYYWSLNDGAQSAPVYTASGIAKQISVVPNKVFNKLEVWSVNAAAVLSSRTTYYFVVNPLAPEAWWSFDNPSQLADNTGIGSGVTLNLGTNTAEANGRQGGGLGMGTSSPGVATTNVSTTTGFTVATWVRLNSDQSTTLIAASASGSSGHAFELNYIGGDKKWSAGRRDASGTLTATTSATGSPGTWTHLAATYDAGTNKVTLFVNGNNLGTYTYSSAAWANTTTAWRLGCGLIGGVQVRCLDGQLDEVRIYKTVASDAEISALANPLGVTDHRAVLASAASWDMSDAASSTTANDSVFGASLTLSGVGSAPFTTLDGNSVLALTGASGQQVEIHHPLTTSPSHPAVDTTGAFTVTARVKPSVNNQKMVIAQQRDGTSTGWTLGYDPVSGSPGFGQWVFQTFSSAGTTYSVRSNHVANPELNWTDLEAEYDSSDPDLPKIRLYVNGRAFNEDLATNTVHELDFGAAWAARGVFAVGNGNLNGSSAPFNGVIDLLRLFAGPFDDNHALDYHTVLNP